MFRNEKTTDSKQLSSYYEMLGFTKEQCQILSLFGFNDEELILAITLYNESSLKLKGISFVKSLSDFIDFYGVDDKNELLEIYMFKLTHGSKFDNLTKGELVKEFEKGKYDIYGYDRDGYDNRGYNREGYDRNGYDIYGYDRNGYDLYGYDRNGFNKKGINRLTGTKYDKDGYDRNGYDKDGYDRNGRNKKGINRFTGTKYDKEGYDKNGFNKDGIHKITGTKYDAMGFDKHGYDECGYDCYGYDRPGFEMKRKDGFFCCESMRECKSVGRNSPAYMSKASMSISKSFEKDFLENTRYDKYQQIEEKGFLNVLSHPTSTFRTNCNTASLDNIKVNIREGYSIEKSMVRTEELLNYFNYDLEDAKKGNKFGITVKMGDKPNSDNKMVLVGVKGENVAPSKQNIVLLLDVSGSMSGNVAQMQLTLMTFIAKLNKGDKFSLITYSNNDTTIIDDITFDKSQIDSIIERILTIRITGYTNGSGALNSAYHLIKSNKIEDGINRVVIMTDGDFNFGDCSTDSVEKLILEKKKTGAYLSVIGTGTWNTNDELMETLAKNGNGNYCIVNDLEDVEENVYNKYNKLMYTIATDVKAQIEFNPKYIKSYRLIGYENRTLNHEDFKDDKVIAEPYGCGNYSIALYEVEMNDNSDNDLGLKYQKSEIVESDELCNVSIRYKELGEIESKEESKSILYKEAYVDKDSDLDLAYSLFVIAENLRESEYINKEDVKAAKLILKQLEHDKKYTINDSKLPVAEFLIK